MFESRRELELELELTEAKQRIQQMEEELCNRQQIINKATCKITMVEDLLRLSDNRYRKANKKILELEDFHIRMAELGALGD